MFGRKTFVTARSLVSSVSSWFTPSNFFSVTWVELLTWCTAPSCWVRAESLQLGCCPDTCRAPCSSRQSFWTAPGLPHFLRDCRHHTTVSLKQRNAETVGMQSVECFIAKTKQREWEKGWFSDRHEGKREGDLFEGSQNSPTRHSDKSSVK
jgi:hypothetical protein